MRSSVAIPSRPAIPRLPYAKQIAVLAAQLAVVATLLWFGLPQGLGGRAGWVMVSGTSMLPRYHTGDLVLVERQASYHRGEVIAYRVPKGDPMAGAQVIHRIIGGDPQRGFVVQGDNRTEPDPWRPTPGDVVGTNVLRVPDALVVLQFLRAPLFLALLAAVFTFVQVLSRAGTAAPSVLRPERPL
jgi:signal peptidase I